MPTLPEPTANQAYLDARDSFARECLERGVPAIYRPQGLGDGTLVYVLLDQIGLMPARGVVGPRNAQTIGTRQTRSLHVCAAAPNEVETVAESGVCVLSDPEIGAIVNLDGGDTFEVKAANIGVTGRGTEIELRVPPSGPTRVGYRWSTEVQA